MFFNGNGMTLWNPADAQGREIFYLSEITLKCLEENTREMTMK